MKEEPTLPTSQKFKKATGFVKEPLQTSAFGLYPGKLKAEKGISGSTLPLRLHKLKLGGGKMSSLPPPAADYPHSTTTASSHHHSRGSFGPVFIVLAVITILAAIACFLGRVCARRRRSQLRGRQPGRAFSKGDLEDGFEMSNPTGRLASNGVTKEGKASENGGITQSQAKPTEHGVRPGA